MKHVILSHDAEPGVYAVPDEIADHLDAECWEFAANWLWKSPHAKKYHRSVRGIDVVFYDADDFIDYLNSWRCPEERSVLVERLSCAFYALPAVYAALPRYNF